jgi:hydrogenase-4 membrane subunit HyfE
MNGYETLEFVSQVITLSANVLVAGVCFERYQVNRSRALLLLAISGSLAVFSIFTDLLLLRKSPDESAYAFIWTGIVILNSIDIILYAMGVTLLVKEVTKRTTAIAAGTDKADPASN